jgi:hypothetical protein
MNNLKKYLVALLLLVLLLGPIFVESLRSFFILNVVRPASFVIWAVLRILNSVDQDIYWLMLILVCAILVIRLLPANPGSAQKGAYKYGYRASSRIEHWQVLITEAAPGTEDDRDLRDNLQRLFISALGPRGKQGPIDLEEIASGGKAPLSLRAQRFLLASKDYAEVPALRNRFRTFLLAPRWMRRWTGKLTQQNTKLIDEILERMEREMEISHDR